MVLLGLHSVPEECRLSRYRDCTYGRRPQARVAGGPIWIGLLLGMEIQGHTLSNYVPKVIHSCTVAQVVSPY